MVPLSGIPVEYQLNAAQSIHLSLPPLLRSFFCADPPPLAKESCMSRLRGLAPADAGQRARLLFRSRLSPFSPSSSWPLALAANFVYLLTGLGQVREPEFEPPVKPCKTSAARCPQRRYLYVSDPEATDRHGRVHKRKLHRLKGPGPTGRPHYTQPSTSYRTAHSLALNS